MQNALNKMQIMEHTTLTTTEEMAIDGSVSMSWETFGEKSLSGFLEYHI